MAPSMWLYSMGLPVTSSLLLLTGSLLIIHAAKLNAPKVLLPYCSSVVVNFTLEVEYSPEEAQIANCYQWLSSRPEVAQVHLINSTDGTCAQTAVVSAISKTPHQVTTVILAENKATGEILRANVIVGEISRLEIETTTRLLFLEDTPQEFIARGFDSDGNIFSNLEGMLFEWRIILDNETGQDTQDAHNILRIKRFTDSHYTTPRHIAPLEKRNMQGDTILIEGIRTGSAKVSARIKDPVYKNIISDEVRILIVANLMLQPPDAYVLVHGRVKYKVELLKQNFIKQIEMPSNQYYLEVKDTDICQLEVQTSMVTARTLGSTEVVLKDRNIASEFPHPSAMIHVVAPNFLVFVVLPHRNWVLETGREYEIYIEIYGTDSHKLYPSDNVRVVADFPELYLEVLFSSVNGTYHRVRTLLKGETFIDGALTSVVDDNGKEHTIIPKVKKSQDVEIFDPITVTPVKVVFPWDPVTRCIHKYTAQAKGGSGEFVWSVSGADVATVAVKGQITTVGPGRCNVTASDVKNSAHFGVSVVHVLPPSDMNFPPSVVEAAVGTKLTLPLSVSAKIDGKLVAFTDCRMLTVNVSLSDMSVFEYILPDQNVTTALPGDGCMSLTFLATHQGHAEVTATYRSKNVLLKATVMIAAFNPLKAIDPEEQTVVAIGSSREIVFIGGPQPWVLDSSKFFHDLNIPVKNQKVKAERLSPVTVSRGTHSFILTCYDLSDQEVQLTVGNGRTARNSFPVSETTSIRFVCAEPVELYLVPVMRSKPRLPPCPIHHENNIPIPIHFGMDLDLVVMVTDSSGRHLDNFTSLAVDWSVSAPHLAELLYTKDLRTETDGPDRTTSTALQTLRPHRKTGSVVVTASIDRYKPWASKVVARQKDKITSTIRKSLELLLVEEAVLSPSSVSVFNHPSNKVSIEVQYGSGYFYLEDLHSLVLTARYDSKDRAVKVTPLKDGSHSFTVYDLCIDMPSYPVATVSVSGVSSVQVMVIDKVEVMNEVTASVQVLDLKGKPLLASFFSLMELRLEAASDILTLRAANRSVQDSVTRLYTVYGAVVGHTSLTATIRLPTGQVIYSSPKPMEVFPPLRLEPKNITLIIGAVFQVLAYGGPQPQSSVEFSVVGGSRVATVNGAGVLDALEIGTTRVIGKSVGTDSVTGEKVVYSQDDAVVNVVTLKGIRIQTALTRLQTGTQMPVFAVGLTEHETPLSFGHSMPPLTFRWSVNNMEVLHLQSVYHKSGIAPSREDSFAQQAVAKQSGYVTVKLKVETRTKSRLQIHEDGLLQDEVQIHVFEKLSLLTPAVCHGQILITPNTDTLLKTNRDVAARVRYVIMESKPETPVVRLLDNGQLRSGPIPGSAILHVTAEEEFGLNQTLVILILVKPVSYLMINSDTIIQTSTSSQLSAVPIGALLQFHVSYHDDVGDEFYATNVQLGVRCSRYDLVQVSADADNNTLLVRAAEPGSTVLKVWDKSRPTVADYVNIPVASAIQPTQASLTLGSVICFNSPIIAEKGTWGWWKSKSDLLYVDEKSGIGVGTGVGRSTVIYAFSPLISTKTEVTIEPIKTVTVSQGIGFLTNSISKGKSLFFPVSFSDGENIVGPNCSSLITEAAFSPSYIPYHCLLELTQANLDVTTGDLFTITAHFDKDKGLHGCLVIQNPASHTSQQIATLDTSLVLSARVPSSLGQVEVLSNHLILDLLPAFHIHNSEIHLTTLSPLSSIRISSSAKIISDIQVVVSDSNLIQVLSPERDSNSNNVILFPVRLLDSLTLWEREHLDLSVEVVHARIGHTVQVPVVAKLIGQKPDIPHLSNYRQDLSWSSIMRTVVSNYQSWLIICFILILIAAAMLFGYHAIFGPKYRTTSSPNVFLNTSGMQPSSPSSFIQQSPPAGSTSFTSPRRTSPIASPKLWSISYNQDLRPSPHMRNTYSFTKS